MKKRLLVSAVLFIATLLMVIFGFKFLHKKKTIQISIQEQQAEDSKHEVGDNKQKTENIGQETGNGGQETKNSEQKITNDNQASEKDEQKTADKKESTEKIISRFVSWGFQRASNRKIDTIIVHSTYDAIGNDPFDIAGVIGEYKQYGVSPHYLIDRNGNIYRLVADENIAYHAGASKVPDGRTNVNNFSIGIEMINTMEGKFTNDQYAALNRLIGDLKKQYKIKYVLGHKDIAPDRKTDPWNINWDKVYK